MLGKLLTCAAVCAFAVAAQAGEVPPGRMAAPARGELLYRNACAACHTEQAHWRDKRLVHDWRGLVAQVARWQKVAGQRWQPEDVQDVAAYLNRRFYRLPCPVPGCASDAVGSIGAGFVKRASRAP